MPIDSIAGRTIESVKLARGTERQARTVRLVLDNGEEVILDGGYPPHVEYMPADDELDRLFADDPDRCRTLKARNRVRALKDERMTTAAVLEQLRDDLVLKYSDHCRASEGLGEKPKFPPLPNWHVNFELLIEEFLQLCRLHGDVEPAAGYQGYNASLIHGMSQFLKKLEGYQGGAVREEAAPTEQLHPDEIEQAMELGK